MPKMHVLPSKRPKAQRAPRKKATVEAKANPDDEIVIRSLTYHADTCTRLATELLSTLAKLPPMRVYDATELVRDPDSKLSEREGMENAGLDYTDFIHFPAGNVPNNVGHFAAEYLSCAMKVQCAVDAKTTSQILRGRHRKNGQPLIDCLPIAPALWFCAATAKATLKARDVRRQALDSMIRRARHAIGEVRLMEEIYCSKAA
ncbi:MAG: hypothetical protein IT290_11775 [Deltaproteobacteria bacterium]|nr:hypothetical protein [Deltaproteobacteria bacterium]